MAKICVDAYAGASTRTEICAGKHKIIIDEPPFFGGKDEGPSPVDMFLASLAGGINAIGQWVAKELSMDLEEIRIHIEGQIDAGMFLGSDRSQRAGFSEIVIALEIESKSSHEVKELWRKEVIDRCPIIDNMVKETRLIFKA